MDMQIFHTEKLGQTTVFRGTNRILKMMEWTTLHMDEFLMGKYFVIGGSDNLDMEVKRAIRDYLTGLTPELLSDETYYSTKIRQALVYPEDAFLSFLPFEGKITALDRNALLYIFTTEEEGKGPTTHFLPVRIGTEVGFNCIIRKMNRPFSLDTYIRNRIKHEINQILDGRRSSLSKGSVNPRDLPKDLLKNGTLMSDIDNALKRRRIEDANTYNSRRQMIGDPVKVGGTSPVVNDAQWEQLYLSAVERDLATIATRIRRRAMRFAKNDKNRKYPHPYMLWLTSPYISVSAEDVVEAYTRGLVGTTPYEKWWSLYQETGQPIVTTPVSLFYQAMLNQPRSVIEMWPANPEKIEFDAGPGSAITGITSQSGYIYPSSKLSPNIDSLYYQSMCSIKTAQWENGVVTSDRVKIIKVKDADKLKSNIIREAISGNSEHPQGQIVLEPAIVDGSELPTFLRLLAATQDIRPSVVSFKMGKKTGNGTNHYTALVLPDSYVKASVIPKANRFKIWKPIKDTASTLRGSFYSAVADKFLTTANGFYLESTIEPEIQDWGVSQLLGN